jgi:hypothetical protein
MVVKSGCVVCVALHGLVFIARACVFVAIHNSGTYLALFFYSSFPSCTLDSLRHVCSTVYVGWIDV